LTLFIRQAAVIVARLTLIAGLAPSPLRGWGCPDLIALRVPLAANAAGGAPHCIVARPTLIAGFLSPPLARRASSPG
jgi:hypothetical protein